MLEEAKEIDEKNKLVAFIMFSFLWVVVTLSLLGILDLTLFWATVIHNSAIFGGPVVIYKFVYKKRFREFIPVNHVSIKNWLFVLCIILFARLVLELAITFLFLPFQNNTPLDFLFNPHSVEHWAEANALPFFQFWIIAAVLPSVFEELLLRGTFLHMLEQRSMSIKKIALINGLVFGFIHISPIHLILGTFYGFIFVYLMVNTRNILTVMIGHFIANVSSGSSLVLELGLYPPFNSAIDLLILSVITIICVTILIILMKRFILYNGK